MKYITSQPTERGAMLLDIEKDKKRLEEADATMKTIADLGESYSEYFKQSKEGQKFLEDIKKGPIQADDGSVKFNINGEALTSEEVLKRAEQNKIDDGAIEIMNNTVNSVLEEAKTNRGSEQPFDEAKYRRTVASMIQSSPNFNSLLSDNVFGTTSFLDDIKELAGKTKYEDLGLDPDIFDANKDGELGADELKAIEDFFLNEENKKAAAKELENYFTMYLKRQYDAQRGVYGGEVYKTTKKYDQNGNVIESTTTSSTSGTIEPGTKKEIDGVEYFFSNGQWVEAIG